MRTETIIALMCIFLAGMWAGVEVSEKLKRDYAVEQAYGARIADQVVAGVGRE